MVAMIKVSHVTKAFGARTVLDDISFSVNDGECVGFLGPNGAGKTTMLRILSGFLGCKQGEVLIDQFDILHHPLQAKSIIGYCPERPPLYARMTVVSYLTFVAQIRRISSKDISNSVENILDQCHLSHVANRIIHRLSKGYRQRLNIAQALIHQPKILLLDEPTVGLDPEQLMQFRTIMRDICPGRTVLVSSHILTEIQRLCSRAIVIHQGKIKHDHLDTTQNSLEQQFLEVIS